MVVGAEPAPAGAGDRLARRRRDRDVRRPRRSPAGASPSLVCLSFLSFGVLGFWQDSIDILIVTGISVAIVVLIGMPLAVLDRHQRAGQQGDHRDPRPDADDADVRLPAAGRAVLRHRRVRGRREHDGLRPAAARPDRRLRDPGGLDDHDRGHRLGWPDLLAAAAQGAAADGPQDHHRRPQPDDDGRAVDGHHRGLRRRPGPRQARAGRPADQRRRRRLRAGRADRGDGDHARPHHDGGQRASARRSPAAAAATSGSGASSSRSGGVARPRRGLPLAHLPRLAEFPVYTIGDKLADGVDDFMDWVTEHLRRDHRRVQGQRHQLAAQPDAGAARRVAVVRLLRRRSPRSPGLRWVPGARVRPRLPRRHLVLRPVAQRDDHPDHDAGRHRAGDGPRPGLRRLDGPRPQGRPRHPAAARRRADDPAVRLPDPGARPVRTVPLHRDRGRHRLRRAGRDQAGGRRRQGRLADDHRGGRSTGQTTLAGDHQGPAADGQGLAGARGQPGPALRAVDGRHRRPGRRRRARLRRRLRLLAQRGVGQGPGRGHHHRAARHHARPDHPGCCRRTPRRRSRAAAGVPHPAADRTSPGDRKVVEP